MEANNMAAMREALIKARSAICHFARYQCQSLSWENSNIQANCADILCSRRGLCEAKTAINAALAAPPRNCDVGTAEEQAKRFCEFCNAHTHQNGADFKCHMDCSARNYINGRGIPYCQLKWAQMPYEEGGAK